MSSRDELKKLRERLTPSRGFEGEGWRILRATKKKSAAFERLLSRDVGPAANAEYDAVPCAKDGDEFWQVATNDDATWPPDDIAVERWVRFRIAKQNGTWTPPLEMIEKKRQRDAFVARELAIVRARREQKTETVHD
jgi:hypothetical protein